VLGVLTFEKCAAVAHLPLASYLGDASYSIYLWHTMAISVVAKAAVVLALPAPIACAAAVVAGTALGAAAHEILEKPIATLLKSRWRERRSAPASR
jgi:exopolysaccharide production protein ExoZ